MDRTLYRLEGCPFCELVVDRLERPGLDYESVWVSTTRVSGSRLRECLGLDYESVWVEGQHSKRDTVARVSGQRVVPVLVDEPYGVTMAESEHILEFLDTAHAGDADEPAVSTP